MEEIGGFNALQDWLSVLEYFSVHYWMITQRA